jgi:hypothetical protein
MEFRGPQVQLSSAFSFALNKHISFKAFNSGHIEVFLDSIISGSFKSVGRSAGCLDEPVFEPSR